MVGGLIALVVVLAAASAAGLALRQRQGRFHQRTPGHDQPSSADALSAADLGAPLGARATLVQFSTEVCAYCGPTRALLTEVAMERDGVRFVPHPDRDHSDPTPMVTVSEGAANLKYLGPDEVQFDVRQKGWDEAIELGMDRYELAPVKEAAE